MNLVQLRYFVTVARQKSVTRASAELRVSQPAVTRQLKLLERELDAVLFARQHRGVELTDAGLVLLERAEFQIRAFEEMRSEFRNLSFAPSGRIRIGCPPSLTRQLLSKPVKAFLAQFPQVTVEVRESISDALKQAIIADQLDIAIIGTHATESHLVREFLFREPIWLFGPRQARLRKISINDLADRPLIMTRRNNAARDLIDRQMRDLALRQNIVVETDSTQLIEELLRSGSGYAAAPYFTFIEKVKSRQLGGSPIDQLAIDRSLIRRRDRPLTKAIKEFLKLLHKELDRATHETVAFGLRGVVEAQIERVASAGAQDLV